MTKEAPEPQHDENAEPLNREERRALARGKKTGKAKQPIGKKSNVRSQMPKGGPGKFQLPTKNG
ncbi:hypothetical protein AB0B28_09550 [Glycomyces sp. NPDC046736]|uniref:hypothetical protein n=1 Tax=Glycomyces sp. NPDC046736 TaxID=3155615 RepID=UPI0033F49C1C